MTRSDALHLRFAPFELDEADARLSSDGRPVALTPKAFAVLCALARRAGQLVHKDELLDAVWGHRHVSESVLKTLVSEVRAALGDDARDPRFIETASRRGYRFIGPVADASYRGRMTEPSPAVDPVAVAAPRDGRAPIGRDSEMARALAAWRRIEGGGRPVLWITGEAGVGKSTLIDAIVAHVGARHCLRGQCVEQFGSSEPYLPVLEALAARSRDDPTLQPLMRSVAPTWLVQMPWLCNASERVELQRELSGAHPDRMLRELVELLTRCAADRPLLLILEDLHWSDHATMRLIDYVARSRATARVLWLCSFRPADAIATDHPLAGLRHELRLRGRSDEIALDAFSERDLLDYLSDRFECATISLPFVRSLHANTEGLPLFVVNLVDELVARGDVRVDAQDGFPNDVAHVPSSVAAVIEQRIARIAPDLQRLLEAASVCGIEFGTRTLGEALDESPDLVATRCEGLERGQFWLSAIDASPRNDGSLDPRFRFRHALYRHVVYTRLGTHRKATIHRRVAESLERQRGVRDSASPAEIASHFDHGHEPPAALRYYVAAVEKALHRLAPVEAIKLIERGLAVLAMCPATSERDGIELRLQARMAVTVPLIAGFHIEGPRVAFVRARALCDALPGTLETAWILHGLGWASYSRGDYADALSLARRARAVGLAEGEAPLVAGACDLIAFILFNQGALIEARKTLEEGIAASDRAGSSLPKGVLRTSNPSVSLRSMLTFVLMRLGEVHASGLSLRDAVQRRDAVDQPFADMVVEWAFADRELRLDRPERAAVHADALLRLATEKAIHTAEGPGLWFSGCIRLRAGEHDEGLRLIEQGIDRHQAIGRPSNITTPYLFAADALASAGRWDEAQRYIDEGSDWIDRLGEQVNRPDLLLQQARVAFGTGRPDAARAAWLDAARIGREQQARWVELRALVALCESGLGRTADRLALRDVRDRLPGAVGTALAARADALLAEGACPAR